MRYVIIVLCTLFLSVPSALAQVGIGIGLPGINIGINLPLYPELVRVPGYPVYYAPQLDSNFFFYDGMYWVYERDNWYASSWYNGPWDFVAPEIVPLFVLRIPVRYYRNPPRYFRGWRPEAPPRWGDHWGNDWRQQRSGWNKWNRRSAPAPAPLPVYQRNYSGEHYPHVEQQRDIHNQNYHYQPRDNLVRQHDPAPATQKAPMPNRQGQQQTPQERNHSPQNSQRIAPLPSIQQGAPVAPHIQSSPRGGEDAQRPAPVQGPPARNNMPAGHEQKQSPQGAVQHEQREPTARQDNNRNDRGAPQEQGRGQGQEKERESGEAHGQGRNR
jgi:hypothetical protein